MAHFALNMLLTRKVIVFLGIFSVWIEICYGHGFVSDPPSRSFVNHPAAQARYVKECDTGSVNYNRHALRCGGRPVLFCLFISDC